MRKQYIHFSLGLLFFLFTMGLSLYALAEGLPESPPGLPPGGMSAPTASVTATEGDWTFKLITSENSVTSTITAYSGKSKSTIIVPSVLGGAKVTAISAQAFGHHNEIAAVYVPDTVVNVEEWAFYDLNTATILSFANPKVEIKDGAFMSSGNAVLYLPADTSQRSAGGKKVVTANTKMVSVEIENAIKAAIAGGTYLNVETAGKENQITSQDIMNIASGTFTSKSNQANETAVITFSGADYTISEQKIVIAEPFQSSISSDNLNKTFRVLSKADADKLNQAIAGSRSYGDVKNLLYFTEGYYVNGSKITLDKDIVAYDVATGTQLYGSGKEADVLPNANPNLYYQYVEYQDKDNDGDIDVLYYSPYRMSYNYSTVALASNHENLNGLSARTALNPAYLSFANAIVKAKGAEDDQAYASLTVDTAKGGNKVDAGIDQERSVLWADDYGTIRVDQLQAVSTSKGNWAKMSYESGLDAYNMEVVMEWGMNAVLYATNGGVVTVGSKNSEQSTIYANGDGANGVLAGGAGSKAGTDSAKTDTSRIYVYNTDFTLEGWNNHVADVVYGGYAYLEDVKATTGMPGSYAVGQGSALANDFGNGVVDAKNFHATVYGNRSAGVYVIGGGIITAQDSSFHSTIDAGLVVASGGTLRMKDSQAAGAMAFRNRGGITPNSTSVFNNVSFVAEKEATGYVTGDQAYQAMKAWKTASGGAALSGYMMSDPAMTIGQLCENYGVGKEQKKTLIAALGKTAGKAYTENTLLRNSILDNSFYNYSAGQYSGDADFSDVPYLTVGSSFGGLTRSVFEFEAAGVSLELNNSTFENTNDASYHYLVASEAGSAPILNFNQSDASGIIWNEGDTVRAVEGRSADRSSSLTVRFTGSTFSGSFADGYNGLWEVAGLSYLDAGGNQSSYNGNYYQAKANWQNSAEFDKDSVWVVTNDSYLGSLTLEAGARVEAPAGCSLSMTVNGVETKLNSGTYKGQIIIKVVKR